ncbi:unnamed protein product [Phytophthora fragariaefolia]|uniref:Unnamed protein product n=1 Tax=Phytophthora fragariaefolia TaxID=1490495 RepID=A0A9W6XIA5_9STRA|nr:unnamed protein product [Phytophthora fragariaefolia]
MGISRASNQSMFWACASAPLSAMQLDSSEPCSGRRGSHHSDITLDIDSWTTSNPHYVALFVVFDSDGTGGTSGVVGTYYFDDVVCSSRRFLLLAFSPLEVQGDLSAQSQCDLIADTMSYKPWSAVKFLLVDNYSVNEYISWKEYAIPSIGRTCHRLNLVAKNFMKREDELICKLYALMSKLRTVKGCHLPHLSPLLRNDTRWWSTYDMLARYVELQPAITQLGHELLVDHEVHPLLLRRAKPEGVTAVEKVLTKFEGVNQVLYKSTLTISAAHCLFGVKEYLRSSHDLARRPSSSIPRIKEKALPRFSV